MMTDREFIISRFVDKYYELSDVYNDAGVTIPFCIRYKGELFLSQHSFPGESSHLSVDEFAKHVVEMYTDFETDEGITVTEMIKDWFIAKYDEIYDEISKSLEGVRITLGARNWELSRNGEVFFWKQLVNEYDGNYSAQSIKVIYDNWYQLKVMEVSEKELNAPF